MGSPNIGLRSCTKGHYESAHETIHVTCLFYTSKILLGT